MYMYIMYIIKYNVTAFLPIRYIFITITEYYEMTSCCDELCLKSHALSPHYTTTTTSLPLDWLLVIACRHHFLSQPLFPLPLPLPLPLPPCVRSRMSSNSTVLHDCVVEFLECLVHQLLAMREIYPSCKTIVLCCIVSSCGIIYRDTFLHSTLFLYCVSTHHFLLCVLCPHRHLREMHQVWDLTLAMSSPWSQCIYQSSVD